MIIREPASRSCKVPMALSSNPPSPHSKTWFRHTILSCPGGTNWGSMLEYLGKSLPNPVSHTILSCSGGPAGGPCLDTWQISSKNCQTGRQSRNFGVNVCEPGGRRPPAHFLDKGFIRMYVSQVEDDHLPIFLIRASSAPESFIAIAPPARRE
jgi:hypothetical protein